MLTIVGGGLFAFLLRQLLRLEGVLNGRVQDAFEHKGPHIGDGDGQLACGVLGGPWGGANGVALVVVVGVLELFADRLGQERAGGEAGRRAELGRGVKGGEGRVEGEHLFQTFFSSQFFR